MFEHNPLCQLFGTAYPIVQAGMVWNSGWRLASAAAEAGCLGLIGSGSMSPDVLQEHLDQARAATTKPWGVNVPLIYPQVAEHMARIADAGVRVVFTSAGNPKKWTPWLQERGIWVVHVVSSAQFARKAEEAGCDAVVCEGFEAGGHNGREETTSMVLIPLVRRAVSIPVIAAGGIATGQAMLAAMALGADGVQMGSRFAASAEASSHEAFKQAVVEAGEGDTILTLKQVVPVRLIKNAFYELVAQAEARGASAEELKDLLGRGRAKRGMFEGVLEAGELEIGQVSAQLDAIRPVHEIVARILQEYRAAKAAVQDEAGRF
jgi:enoyl-[acyl-carrier protein] reductase II